MHIQVIVKENILVSLDSQSHHHQKLLLLNPLLMMMRVLYWLPNKYILEAVQITLGTVDVNNTTIEALCTQIGVSTDTYMAALSLASKGPNVILKGNPCDIFIYPSNTAILQFWGGNIDLQYVINEIVTVMHVCSYMTKGKKEWVRH